MKNVYKSNYLRCALWLIVSVLLVSAVDGQSNTAKIRQKSGKQTAIRQEQASFSSEGKILSPVTLPEDVLQQLAEYDDGQLAKCQQEEFTRKANAASHFAASRINLNGDKAPDLIVQARTPCFMGAHNTTFWIFCGKSGNAAPSYELTFDIAVDYLRILKTSTNNYRDVETASHTAVELYTIDWKFDGTRYRKNLCRITDLTTDKVSKVDCDL